MLCYPRRSPVSEAVDIVPRSSVYTYVRMYMCIDNNFAALRAVQALLFWISSCS